MALLDWIVIGLFTAAMIWIVVSVMRKQKDNSSD